MRGQSYDCSNDARFSFTRGDADDIPRLFLVTESSHGASELLVAGLKAAGEQIFVYLPLVADVLPILPVRDVDVHPFKLVVKVVLILQVALHRPLLGFELYFPDGGCERLIVFLHLLFYGSGVFGAFLLDHNALIHRLLE